MTATVTQQVAHLNLAQCEMTASASTDDVVVGSLDRAAGHDGAELSRAGVLIDFAEFLTATACKRFDSGASVAKTIQSSINIFAATPARVLSGECRVVHLSDNVVAGTTEIRDGEIGLVAVVTQTVTLTKERQNRHAAATKDSVSRFEENDSAGAKILALARTKARKAVDVDETDIPAVRRQQIFDAAVKIITTKGFERSTIREITREAGLTIPTMYQYFKRKDDILELIFDAYIQKMETDLHAAIASQQTAKDRLTAAVHVTLTSLHKYHREILVMTQDTKSLRSDVKKIVIKKMLRYLSIFVEIIELGVKTGEFRKVEPELYGNLIPMMCQVWVQRYWSVGKFGLRALEKAVLDLTIRGLEKRTSV